MFELRDYQRELVREVNTSLLNGERPCLVAPTGSGKTVMLAELARLALERGEQVVVAAHRNEIIKQLVKSLEQHLGQRPGVTSGPLSTGLKDVQVVMMPTLARRSATVEALQARTMLLDECHHCQSKSYQRIITELQPLRFAGATATPITPTGAGLGKYGIDRLVLGPQPKELMDSGALAPYRLYAAPAEIDLEGVRVRGGDFAVDDLGERVVRIHGSVVRDYRQFNPTGAPTIAVTVSVDHAYELAEVYAEAGVSAEVVIGTTPQKQRESAFRRFEAGELKVLVSVALIDEGLDLPAATCLQLLRPTRSLRLWKQLVGRVLRPSPGKDHAVIIDHGGCWERLPLPCELIDWQLHVPTRPRPQPVQKDKDREVKRRQIEIEVEEDEQHLQLVSVADVLQDRLEKRLKSLNKNLYLVEHKNFNPVILRSWALNPSGVCAAKRRRIEKAMMLPAGWIDENEAINSMAG